MSVSWCVPGIDQVGTVAPEWSSELLTCMPIRSTSFTFQSPFERACVGRPPPVASPMEERVPLGKQRSQSLEASPAHQVLVINKLVSNALRLHAPGDLFKPTRCYSSG